AWSAAESAAWSAAWSAARSAAWSAAESAAWSAAESAAWSAAESAALVDFTRNAIQAWRDLMELDTPTDITTEAVDAALVRIHA
ncbi:hypothetical protein, partial [Mycolicibacterium conceptionense]|uniref:hypothetical protein n=1 Tax=Mycolicibacterium conceptionense TaxID=451644 RepID=UPI001C2BBF6D